MSRSHGCDGAAFWFVLKNISLYFSLRAIVLKWRCLKSLPTILSLYKQRKKQQIMAPIDK